MPLTLTLDHNRHNILEPGYRTHISSAEALASSEPEVGQQARNIWRCPVTGTLMLKPLNIQSHWLNSVDQLDSIIRLSRLVVGAGDLTARTVFEESAFGNSNNPYIWHAPITFSNPPAFGPPGAPPNLVGAPYGDSIQDGLTSIEVESELPAVEYTAPNTTSGTINSGRVIAYTADLQLPNAPFYFRWHHPSPKILAPSGKYNQTRYIFFVGQLAIEIAGNTVVIWDDVSSAGDRSSFRRIWGKPMFTGNDFSAEAVLSFYAVGIHAEGDPHDRGLLVIPYFRNRILLVASNGTAYSVPVRRTPRPAPEVSRGVVGPDNYNWEITRADTLAVWALSPAPGRFQVQKVRYADGPVTIYLPKVVLPYTPAVAPTIGAFADAERGTGLTVAAINPAVYTFRHNAYNECPPPETGTGDPSRTYDVTVVFNGEATHRWTPFFYGLDFHAPTVTQAMTATPSSVLDTGVSTANIINAFVGWGEKPGDGRCEIALLDEDPYALSPYYSRTSLPIQLLSGGVPVFTGLATNDEVAPGFPTVRPRGYGLEAVDLWQQLANCVLRDQASFFGGGHITVVLHLARQAGINTATAETPPLNATYNTPIGALATTARTEEEAKLIRDYWRPKNLDTAGSMITRIAQEFSGWDVGFRSDGTFFYLPKHYLTGLALRFFNSDAERIAAGFPANPLVRNPVRFETIEPEANAVLVYGAENKLGQRLSSSPWIDFASWQNPAAPNYLSGQLKWIVYEIGDTLSCEELNRVARVIWEAARKRKRRILFESDFVPSLKLGQLVEIGTYGTARLKQCKAEFVDDGWSPATYTVEFDA